MLNVVQPPFWLSKVGSLTVCLSLAVACLATHDGNRPVTSDQKHGAHATGQAKPGKSSSVPPTEENKETGGYGPGQDAADVLKDFTSSDGAFFAAGLIKDGYKKGEPLDALLLYPQDEVMVLKLTGAQIKAAFERSVSLYPQPNTSFLQISGFDVSFSKSAAPGSRVTSARAGGAPIDPNHVYTVAMPASLGRGGLGYFKIWDTPNIAKTYTQSVETVLKGKSSSGSSSRWSVSG